MKWKTVIILALASIGTLAPSGLLAAQSIQVTQVDTGDLLVHGTIDAYVSVAGPEAAATSVDAWSATERAPAVEGGPDGTPAGDRELEIVEVRAGANEEAGIDFLLLVDNSGSMYDQLLRGERRIDHARRALSGFLRSVTGSRDRVALGAFNTYLYPLAPLGASSGELMRSLDRLEEPAAESSYTELYQAMERLLEQFVTSTGRKAVIVLSDGENYPFARHAGVAHPVWGDERVMPEEVIDRYIAEEVSLYAINFADAPDPNLARIADATGGELFEAADAAELARVYASIRDAIRGEVRVSIRVPAARTVERNVTVRYEPSSDGSYDGASDDAEYLAPLLLGAPAPFPWLLALAILLTTGGAIAALHFVSLERPAERAEIQPLGAGRTVVLQAGITVIGSAPEADVSLAGTRGVDRHHATVVHDAERGSYTLVADHPVRVNNSLAKKRRLKPGDVITVEDVTLVFDAPGE
ncbi:MAG: VWA domain-containing protein [Spirochaetota bacterium]